jgi:hypothetical protein
MTQTSIARIIADAVQSVVDRAQEAIARTVEARMKYELTRAVKTRTVAPEKPRRQAPSPARVAMTKWVADRRARRVPTFVIEATGLDTKKKIVARFGENAAFVLGKPLPSVGAAAEPAPRVVKAKGPVIRKRAAR